MKKILTLLLVLAMVLALAACGETKQGEVIENVDPGDNTVVIETPPAIISGPDTQPSYAPAATLPTTAPTTAPNPAATTVPAPGGTGTAEAGGTGTGEGTGEGEALPPAPGTVPGGITYADDTGEDYNPTATQEEKDNSKIAYINAEWVNFRVGPGTQYKIYESLPIGADVKVLGYTDNGWAKIWYNDYMIGYVAKNYLSATKPAAPTVIIEGTTEGPAPSIIVIGG